MPDTFIYTGYLLWSDNPAVIRRASNVSSMSWCDRTEQNQSSILVSGSFKVVLQVKMSTAKPTTTTFSSLFFYKYYSHIIAEDWAEINWQNLHISCHDQGPLTAGANLIIPPVCNVLFLMRLSLTPQNLFSSLYFGGCLIAGRTHSWGWIQAV